MGVYNFFLNSKSKYQTLNAQDKQTLSIVTVKTIYIIFFITVVFIPICTKASFVTHIRLLTNNEKYYWRNEGLMLTKHCTIQTQNWGKSYKPPFMTLPTFTSFAMKKVSLTMAHSTTESCFYSQPLKTNKTLLKLYSWHHNSEAPKLFWKSYILNTKLELLYFGKLSCLSSINYNYWKHKCYDV